VAGVIVKLALKYLEEGLVLLGGVDSSVSWMGDRRVIWILVDPVLEQERAGGDSALGEDEAHFIENICNQGLYPCNFNSCKGCYNDP
jgi:hypothetical protein